MVHERVFSLQPTTWDYEVGSVGPITSRNAAPKYSTDIAAAWLVVAAMRAKGYRVVIEMLPGRASGLPAFVSLHPHLNDAQTATALKETLPLAICLAALASCVPSEAP